MERSEVETGSSNASKQERIESFAEVESSPIHETTLTEFKEVPSPVKPNEETIEPLKTDGIIINGGRHEAFVPVKDDGPKESLLNEGVTETKEEKIDAGPQNELEQVKNKSPIQATPPVMGEREDLTKPKTQTDPSKPSDQSSNLKYQIRDEKKRSIAKTFLTDVAYRRPTVYKQIASLLVKNLSVLSDFLALQEKYADLLVKVSTLEDRESKPPFPVKQMKMKEFLSQVFSDEKFGAFHYLQLKELDRDLLELIEEAGISLFGPNAIGKLIAADHCHSPTFYIGNKGIRTSLHYDRSFDARNVHFLKNDPGKHNLFLQVSGSRRFTLFPESLSKELLPDEGSKWPHVSKSTTFLHTVLDHVPEEKGLAKQLEYLLKSPYPSLAKAWPERIEIVLKGGETLLIPARWWYYTEILEGGSALNWCFKIDDSLDSKITGKPTASSAQCILS